MNKYLNIHLNTYVNNNTFKRLNGEVDVQNGNQPNKTMYNNPNRQKNGKDKVCGILHPKRRRRKDDTHGTRGKLPALCEGLQCGNY